MLTGPSREASFNRGASVHHRGSTAAPAIDFRRKTTIKRRGSVMRQALEFAGDYRAAYELVRARVQATGRRRCHHRHLHLHLHIDIHLHTSHLHLLPLLQEPLDDSGMDDAEVVRQRARELNRLGEYKWRYRIVEEGETPRDAAIECLEEAIAAAPLPDRAPPPAHARRTPPLARRSRSSTSTRNALWTAPRCATSAAGCWRRRVTASGTALRPR